MAEFTEDLLAVVKIYWKGAMAHDLHWDFRKNLGAPPLTARNYPNRGQ